MLDNEDLNEVLDPVGGHPPPRFLLFRRRIAAFKPSCKDLLRLGARHLERHAPIGADRVLPEPRPGTRGTVEHDKHLATPGGDLDAESRQASIPINGVIGGSLKRIDRALGQTYSRHEVSPWPSSWCYLDSL